ncbi:MAG: YidB family protein, partial [Methylotenera sp.]
MMCCTNLCIVNEFNIQILENKMGLFDSVADAVMGKLGGDQGNMALVAMEMFNQNGGLSGVIEKFKAGGLAEQAASWVGTG